VSPETAGVFNAENAENAEGKRQFQVPGSEFQVNGKRQQTSAEDADGRRWMRGKGTAGRGTVQAEGLNGDGGFRGAEIGILSPEIPYPVPGNPDPGRCPGLCCFRPLA